MADYISFIYNKIPNKYKHSPVRYVGRCEVMQIRMRMRIYIYGFFQVHIESKGTQSEILVERHPGLTPVRLPEFALHATAGEKSS